MAPSIPGDVKARYDTPAVVQRYLARRFPDQQAQESGYTPASDVNSDA